MDTFVGILRGPDGLTALLVRRNVAPEFESREAAARAMAGADPWYEIIEQPLEALAPSLRPDKETLRAAWEALGTVRAPAPQVSAAARTVLAGTVLGRPAPAAPLPPLPDLPRPVRPTAAHPRAYRGTKLKPPQAKMPGPVDLRPVLCGSGRSGLLTEKEDAALAAEARLPEAFRVCLFPLIRGRADAEAAEHLALYWALGLDADAARRAAFARLLSLEAGPSTARWGRLTAALPDEWRTLLLCLLLASGAWATDPDGLPPGFAASLSELFGGPDPCYRLFWLLRGLTAGIEPGYLQAGYRLEDAYTDRKTFPFHEITRGGYFPEALVSALWERLAAADNFYPGYALTFWKRCGLQPGLGELAEGMEWARDPPKVAFQHLRFHTYWDDDLSGRDADAKWWAIRSHCPAFEALLREVPEDYKLKCLDHLSEYLWQWDDPQTLSALLPAALSLTRRLCQPPFSRGGDPTRVIVDFLAEVAAPLRERFLSAPDASFRRLEAVCRRDNDASLVGGGTWALTRQAAEFSVRCFEECPGPLFKAAKLLGSLSDPAREGVVRAGGADLAVPDPRPGLAALERAALDALAQGLAAVPETSGGRHALQMQRAAAENRRALRKLLAAHWRGRADYLAEHPQSRRWREQHPRLDWDVWRRGVTSEAETADWGRVSLAVEADPLEALKMGTYVGSCLGLGGSFAYSAAAVVLDINKQVVYARDARGSVVGRQVVAIADDDRLVCFEVYPLSAQTRLGGLFADYDRRLAQALGLPIHDPRGEDDYEIAHILSHAWWDDSAWDLKTEDAAEDGQPK